MIPSPTLNVGDILDNSPGVSELSGPTLVLDIQHDCSDPMVWLIDRERSQSDRPSQRKAYVCQPYALSLSWVKELLQTSRCVVLDIRPDRNQYSDADQLNICISEKSRAKLIKQLKNRDERFAAIKPLVCKAGGTESKPVSEIFSDPMFAHRLKERARELGKATITLRKWINRYWANGSTRSGLIAGYAGRCGNPGHEKKQDSKLGRSPRLFKTGHWKTRGYSLSQQDKQRLGLGFALISRENTPRDAYLMTCSAFWSTHEESAPGQVHATLYPREMRPSFDQFMRWGSRLHGKSVRDILLGPTASRQVKKTSGKSEQDSIVAVGQQAMFDGTSTDVYLVSILSRLKKLPPMNRLILKESRTGVIFGMYCGWEPPSPKTALLAVLHGALKDKRAWAKRFGVDIAIDAIPGLLPRSVLADNGELKGTEPTEFEQQYGIGFYYTPAMMGAAKGGIETEHQKFHKHVDHKIPGTTHGKQRKRGETHPALEALWNYTEYMPELIRHIVWHNTVQEVPDLAPIRMLLDEPDIKPTRINIYNWLTRQGLNVGLNVDYNDLRAYTLSDIDAVICKNGIRLMGKIHGHKTRIPRLRYTSEALAKSGLLTKVKLTGKVIPVRMKMDSTDLSQAWLPTRGGLIRVTHYERDSFISRRMVLEEWISYCEQQIIRTDLLGDEGDQYGSDKVQRFAAVTDSARSEEKAERASRERKPSKKSISSHLGKHVREEIELLRRQDQLPEVQHQDSDVPATDLVNHIDITCSDPTMADDAMSRYLGDE